MTGQVDISRPSGSTVINTGTILGSASQFRAGAEEAMFFQFGVEAGSGAELESFVSQKVVPFGAVAPHRADQAMVAIDVHDIIAQRAAEFSLKDWRAGLHPWQEGA